MDSKELLLGLLEQNEPGFVTWEDLGGPHGGAVRSWQAEGFVSTEPGAHPAPSCPGCGEGVPIRVGCRLLCGACHGGVDSQHLLAWRFDREAFLRRLAGRLGLRGEVQRAVGPLWDLGWWGGAGGRACFYLMGSVAVPVEARGRLDAHRRCVVFGGPGLPEVPDRPGLERLSLRDALRGEDALDAAPLEQLLEADGRVRFDRDAGGLWVGQEFLGEVPAGCREHHLLACLAESPDRYLPYADLRREVCRRAGSTDAGGDAAYCHALKRRIKKKWVPRIDELIVTTNRGDGYRLRGWLPDSR